MLHVLPRSVPTPLSSDLRCRQVLSGRLWVDFVVNFQDFAVFVDVEGVALGVAFVVQNPIGFGYGFVFVAQQGEVGAGLFSNAFVVQLGVDAGHEIRHIVFANKMAVLGKLLAFYGATVCVGFGKLDRKSVLLGSCVSVVVVLGVRGILKYK